jgi:hypothetical protein
LYALLIVLVALAAVFSNSKSRRAGAQEVLKILLRRRSDK